MSTLSTTKNDGQVEGKSGSLQFSKAPIMKNYGELPFGEIPEPLKRVNEFRVTTASNGIRVATETTNSQLGGVGVFINSGSRYETLENSGTAFLLERMRRHGTERRSATQL
jgi:predicted Zn-dependent peptidase